MKLFSRQISYIPHKVFHVNFICELYVYLLKKINQIKPYQQKINYL